LQERPPVERPPTGGPPGSTDTPFYCLFARISHIVIFTGVFQASPEDATVRPKLSWSRQLCRRLYLIDTLLVLLCHTRTVLFCVCKVSLQSFDIMPPKSLLSIIIIIILIIIITGRRIWPLTHRSPSLCLSGS